MTLDNECPTGWPRSPSRTSCILDLVRILLVLVVLLVGLAPAKTYLVPVEGEIDPALAVFVEGALKRAVKEGASGVAFFIDTPGGRVDAAIKISDAILTSPLPTLAIVKNAFSAGALIALSAEQVAMLPGSEIGAALPVRVIPGLKYEAAEEKIISALKAKFRAVAEARNRPVKVVEAMVDPKIEIKDLSAKGEPLTLSAKKAVELGVADFLAATPAEALKKAGFDPEVVRVEPGARVRAARLLTSTTVAAVLLAVGVLGLVIEALTPGFGIPGTVGLLALALYFFGGYLAGMSGVLEVLLFFLGVLLLLAEIFLIPGFGVAGIGGIAAILASIYFTFGDQALYVGSLAVILVTLGLVLAARYLPRTRAARALVLDSAIQAEAPPKDRLEALRGARGQALTPLRPAGIAQFGERKVDVVAEGEFIEKGSPVRVVRVEGARVVVRKEEG